MTPSFAIAADAAGRARVSGRIGYANATDALARRRELGADGDTIEVDLSGLESSDSATLAVVIAWTAHARRNGGDLRFSGTPSGLRALAQLCEVDKLVRIG